MGYDAREVKIVSYCISPASKLKDEVEKLGIGISKENISCHWDFENSDTEIGCIVGFVPA